ncbi:Glucosamine inositolphosphorylceramide transferase 1 [Hirschfeldia incana]|nr:Glucosamine inositolphosphorylceramide transferase 1 [Hirschfeldia incana]KAJ0234824.1 Glucosamine inositolphosphorylceramide transferase 1 [Hirschfeldia incana]KAJ0234825.1 Glucosamine inositolphosphorylceramide transferase 1 [Hirschfeldia incana]KAJ0234826.1 Glucosamine inositolphosphorylceramide transferase 1 [Hirschfeldia incana]
MRRFLFFVSCFGLYALVAATYAWLAFPPHIGRTDHVSSSSSLGCREDNEGSWSIGLFYGDSPFTLKPIETMNVWRNESAAWPVANPVLTCASLTNSGFPSNFVADPFLYVQGDTLYLFFENKNPITMHGDIGVAESTDKGATWKPLGIALNEPWHLSFPFVFNYNGEIYMMPESNQIGELRLYRAVNFPLTWKVEKVILQKPLVDPTIIHHQGNYWLFGTHHSSIFGIKKNEHFEIWYSTTPLGPWKPHKKNPVHNGASNGGRAFSHNGNLYRVGQASGEGYEKKIHIFKIEVLTKEEYREVQVPFDLETSHKGQNSWNGARQHRLDVVQLSSGEYIGLVDGDRVTSGDLFLRVSLGYASLAAAITLVVFLGFLLGILNCIVPTTWCVNYYAGKRTDVDLNLETTSFVSEQLRRSCSRLNRVPLFLRGLVKSHSTLGRIALGSILALGVLLACVGVRYIYGGSGAVMAYPLKGHVSKFTLATMTYDARLWNLKMYVKHYSQCPSVKEIVVIWNKGPPPKLTELDSAVPVRIRVEKLNTLNNRFNIDPLIKTRAVLELDDDIMMSCDTIEKGFRVWREHPERLVGYYPRFADETMTYSAEKFARSHKGYNMILTGAAFMDVGFAFGLYQSEKARLGREFVDEQFNCEDVLLNFLYANVSGKVKAVEYVRPFLAIDTSKFSGVAISGNTNQHYMKRSKCLRKFSELYGSLYDRRWEFGGRKDGWDL